MVSRYIDAMALAILLVTATGAAAQVPPPVPVQTPTPNPSSSLVVPQAPEVPVSPGLRSGGAATVTGVPSGDPYGDMHYSSPPHTSPKSANIAHHHSYRHHHS
jgi:hypothetical protein